MDNWHQELLKQFKKQQTGFSDAQLKRLLKRLPRDYYQLCDPDDLRQNLKHLDLILHRQKNKILYESDIETYALMKYDNTLLRNTIKQLYRNNRHQAKLFRLYRDQDKEFFILGVYHKLEDSPRAAKAHLQEPDWENFNLIKNNPGLRKRIEIFHRSDGHATTVEIHLLNTSLPTLINNLMETLEYYDYSLLETRLQRQLNRKVKTIFQVTIRFFAKLTKAEIDSLKKDLDRYLQHFIAYRSIFDIVGPSMVGPSSSHTAGANRIGRISRNVLASLLTHNKSSPIREIKIKLLGSFRDTGVGHHTPEALIGGLSGLDSDAENLIETGMGAIKQKETFHFVINDTKIIFGGFIKGNAADDAFYAQEHNNNIVEIIACTGEENFILTGFSLGGGNVEIRFLNRQRLDEIIDGKKTVHFNYNTRAVLPEPGNDGQNIPIAAVDKNPISPGNDYTPEFNTFEEMIDVFGKNTNGGPLIRKIIAVEQQISGMSDVVMFEVLKNYWQIMNKAITRGLQDNRLSLFGLTGQDSNRVLACQEKNLMGLKNNIYSLALGYAISVNEVNAKSGVIVACPTGGSCGILPAVLKAWEQTDSRYNSGAKEKKILDALLVAGFFGMILFDDVPTAGADLGCQAEIGGAAAMTAAALTYLENGTLTQMTEAFTLTLKNCMGLICDPVAGLVEIPCVKRNGIYATMAVSAAFCALAGVKSMISADEVVLAVKEVGERMHDDYKETARGGLAQTRDGKKVNRLFDQTTRDFFS